MTASLTFKLSLFFGLVGLGVSGYLWYTYAFGIPLPCGSNGCEVVRYSKYSHLFTLPVPFYGVLFYLSVIGTALFCLVKKEKRYQTVLFAIATIGFIFSVYFTSLEVFVIKAICNWCVVSAIVSTILFSLSWVHMLQSRKQ